MRMVWASTSASAQGLNESPSEKEGKYSFETMADFEAFALNESPSEKEGKLLFWKTKKLFCLNPSMKVPPKRKGNPAASMHCES